MNSKKVQPADYLFWAVKQTQLSHLQFRILVTMCDAYGTKGCFLAQETIAKAVGSTRPSVNRTIGELVNMGLITCKGNVKESGAQGSNNYEFPMNTPVSSSDTPVPSCDTPCTVGDTPPVPPAIHPPVPSCDTKHLLLKHPIETPILNTTKVVSLVGHRWPEGWCDAQEFYSRYPRKAGKQAALKAWRKLDPSFELIDIIHADLIARVNQGAWCTGKGKSYIPYPATYLNGRQWEDEIIPRPEFKPPQDFSKLAREAQDLTEYL